MIKQFKKKSVNKNAKTVVICWESNTVGSDNDKLNAYRHRIIDSINSANRSELLGKNKTIVDELVFAPQKKREKSFLKSFKTPNGEFTRKLVK